MRKYKYKYNCSQEIVQEKNRT